MSVIQGDTERTIPLKCIFARNQVEMQLSVKRKKKLNTGSVEANSKITNLEFWPLTVIMWPEKKFLRIKNCGCKPCHRQHPNNVVGDSIQSLFGNSNL